MNSVKECAIRIRWADARLAAEFADERRGKRRLGADQFRALKRRIDSLESASTLEVMRQLPGRCHEMTADLDGRIAIDLVQPYRLLFEPDHDPLPRRPGGGLDWAQVTSIVILEVADYHGR